MARAASAYANTGVPVSQSQEQIRTLLQRSGARGVQFTEDWSTGRIVFRCIKVENRSNAAGDAVEFPFVVRMVIPLWDDPKAYLRASADTRSRRERQVLRALYWYLKSQLEAVAFGLRTFEDVFMADLEMRDGLTVGDHVRGLLDSGKLTLPATTEVR